MNDVTKNVIMDLLPLYLAGELSEDAEILVKKYLEADPELAEVARDMAKANSLSKVPVPFKSDVALETYQEAKKWMTIRTLGLAAIAGLVIMCFLMLLLIGTSLETLRHVF
jgi:hypothetical protein